jgi:hypothetical protein
VLSHCHFEGYKIWALRKQSGTKIKESIRKQDLMAWSGIWGAGERLSYNLVAAVFVSTEAPTNRVTGTAGSDPDTGSHQRPIKKADTTLTVAFNYK